MTAVDPMSLVDILTKCSKYGELVAIMVELGWCRSKSEGRRLIQQGAIRINDEKVTDPNTWLFIHPDETGFYTLGIDRSRL